MSKRKCFFSGNDLPVFSHPEDFPIFPEVKKEKIIDLNHVVVVSKEPTIEKRGEGDKKRSPYFF